MKRKAQSQADPRAFVRRLCDRVSRGEALPEEVALLREIALDQGVYAVRVATDVDLCAALAARGLAGAPPATKRAPAADRPYPQFGRAAARPLPPREVRRTPPTEEYHPDDREDEEEYVPARYADAIDYGYGRRPYSPTRARSHRRRWTDW